MTFCEAYALFGRDSAAIAEACGIDESAAYNLMASRVDRDLGIFPDAEKRREYRRAYYAKAKAQREEIRKACA